MNYLAHAARFLDDPYFAAGTAVPDWLCVVNRKVRVRRRGAAPIAERGSGAERQVAAGILQHLDDDRWFHETQAFAETSLRLAVELRERLPGDEGFRPSFLGHILVEILIDATLMDRDPGLAARYYRAIDSIDPAIVQRVVNLASSVTIDSLSVWIERFASERFLYDYLDDERLLMRLNQVMLRVGLPQLQAELLQWLPEARGRVARACDQLLSPPAEPPSPPQR